MRKITIDQSHQVIATLIVNTDWESIDFKKSGLQDIIARDPKRLGKQFTTFLKNGGLLFKRPNIIKIDRSVPFDLVMFLKGLSIEEEDKRALSLTKIDLNNVNLETIFNPDETKISVEEWLKRLKKTGHILLDAKVFQTLWENQRLIPEKWKNTDIGKTSYILFGGTILRDIDGGRRFVLFIYLNDDRCQWGCYCLDDILDINQKIAVLI